MASARVFVVVLGIVAGLVGGFVAMTMVGLRCFDICPTDPKGELAADLRIAGPAIYALASLAGAWVATRQPAVAARLLILGALGIFLLPMPSLPETGPLLFSAGLALIPAMGAAFAFRDSRAHSRSDADRRTSDR